MPDVLPESSPRLCGPARPCGRGKLAQFSLLQRFAVWWVAPPWPILPVPAVLLALCRLVVIFQNRCWVSGPGVEFAGKGGEEPLSGEEGRGLLLSASRFADRVLGLRGVMRWDRRSSFSGKGGGRTMDGSRARRIRDRARRAWYAGWRQYRFARHHGFLSGTTTSRRGPDLLSNEKSWCTPNVRKEGRSCRVR